MALVQWKQISPQLGNYGQLTGSLEITGSFVLNGQELDLSGGVVSSNQTLSLNGYELSISNGNTITLPQGGGSIDTGSLITSASVSGNVITFTNGDGTTFDITIDTGSAGASTDISALNSFTSSYFVDSASFDNRILNITGSTIDTSSLDARLDALEAATSSYTTGPHTDITALNSFTSSYSTDSASFDNRINSISSTGVPQGTISSSAQITALGFISESSATDITALNSFTSSYYIDSASVHQKFLNITGSSVDTSGLLTTASYQIDSSSFDSRIASIAATGSVIAPFAFGFVNDTTNNSGTGVSWGNWNSSNATLDFTFTTAQPNANYAVVTDSDTFDNYYVGISNKTTTGFRAEFYDDTQSRTPSSFSPFTFVVYGSNPLQSVRVSVSGSAGATDISALNAFTSSYYIDSASFDSRISSINTSGDTSFNGNRVVSNTLLGDLYTDSFNAGTTGSIQDFLTAVFFPSAAPTATFTEQTSKFNTNLATTGTNLNSVSISDTVDDSPYNIVIAGTNGSSFTPVPTNAASSSWEIQAANNLSAGTYSYDVIVSDNNGATRTYSNKTIVIAQADFGTLTPTGNFYIIESATGGPIYLNSNGRTGAQGGVNVSYSPNYGSQVASGFASSNPFINIDPTTGLLTVGASISGSGNFEGAILNSDISWVDQYGNTSTAPINVQVTRNNAPDIIFTNTSNQNTNLAVSGANLVTLTFSDIESDAIDYSSFTFSESTGNLVATRVSNTYQVKATSDLTAGSYAITSSIRDVHGFNTNTETHTFNIAQASSGTITGDSIVYIIESALTGDVFRDATGYNNGNPAQIGVNYSPNYGSQVPTFTSSNASVVVDSNGYLTLGADLSGSVTQSGDTFSSVITWNDQYGNSASSVVTANVFGNAAPLATINAEEVNSDQATSGSSIGTLSIVDTETNSPFRLTLSGISGSRFNAVPLNAASSSWDIQPISSLAVGEYPVTFIVVDNYGEQSLTNKTFTVVSPITDTLYIYDVGQYTGTYNYDLGIQSQNSSTPPVPTSYSGIGFLEKIEDGSLGDSTFTYNWGSTINATLLASASGANVNELLTDLGAISKTNTNRFVIIMPSGSAMTGVPRTTTDQYGGSDLDEYVLEVAADGVAIGSGVGTTEQSNIHKITLATPVNGVSDYIMVGNRNGIASATSIELRLIPESGSAS